MVAIVSGGNRGIGKAIVYELVRKNYLVYFTFNSHEEEALSIVEELGKDNVKPIKCSINNNDDIENLYDYIFNQEKISKIDLLVNNAGITKDNYFAMLSNESFDTVISTNLLGTAHLTRKIIKRMISQHNGVIINVSSVSGIIGAEGQTNYSASKAGIIAFTKSLAKEVGKYGIRVVAIAPGFIKTDMYAKVPNNIKEQQLKNVPLGRCGTAEEVAKLVSFLGSEDASYITGTTISIDGGLS